MDKRRPRPGRQRARLPGARGLGSASSDKIATGWRVPQSIAVTISPRLRHGDAGIWDCPELDPLTEICVIEALAMANDPGRSMHSRSCSLQKDPPQRSGSCTSPICHRSKLNDRRADRRYAKRRPGRRRQVHSRLQRWPTSARRSNIPTLAAMHRHSWCGVSNSSKICVLSLRGAAANLYQSLPISLGIASSPHRLPRDDSLAEP